MRIGVRNIGTAALLCAALVSALPARAAGWIEAQSEHFSVLSDAPEARVRDYLVQLEAFRQVALMVLGADEAGMRAQSRFEIVLLRRRLGLAQVRPGFDEQYSGVYVQCVEGALAYATLQPQRFDGVDASLLVLFHEYAHRLMYQYARAGYPRWYVEGFAEYMGASVLREGKVSIGGVPAGGGQTLAGAWMPYEEVLKPRLRERPDTPSDEWEWQRFYAQSWLLTHYMLSDSERTRKFNAYFERVGAGEDAVAALEPATGIALEALPRLLRRYLRDMPVVSVPAREMPAGSLKVEALPEDTHAVVLPASVLKTCPPKPQGEAILSALRLLKKERGAGPPALVLALARAELLFGDVQAARKALEARVQADDASFEAHHLLGRALTRSAEALEGEARRDRLDRARVEFFKAYRLNQTDAANLYHLARALKRNGVDANTLNAARAAHTLEPTVDEYAVFEALLDLDAGDRGRAVAALSAPASDPHDQKRATRFRQAIDAIKAGKGRAEVSRLVNGKSDMP